MPRRPRAGREAAKTSISVRPSTPTQAAGWIRMVPTMPGSATSVPQKFRWEAGEDELQPEIGERPAAGEHEDARQPPSAPAQASAQGTAMNNPTIRASPGTAKGTSHQNCAASSRIGSVIQ